MPLAKFWAPCAKRCFSASRDPAASFAFSAVATSASLTLLSTLLARLWAPLNVASAACLAFSAAAFLVSLILWSIFWAKFCAP